MKLTKTKEFVASIFLMLAQVGLTAPLGTGFTYQGQLAASGAAANGTFEMRLALFDALAAGSQVALVTNTGVVVSNGLFTTLIDYGAGIFNGTAYWLELGVRTNGSSGAFTTLSPRQPVTPSPYSLYSSLAPLADGSVTSAKILDGAVATVDLANNAVTSAKIADGTIVNADLAANSVSSANIIDGSIVGADIAPNSIGSTELADTIALGTTNVSGRLDVYRTTANTPSITLFGSGSQISTYGSDGLEQIRLWGTGYGEMYLFDNTTNNNLATILSANGSSGGYLALYQGASSSLGSRIYGDSLGGGRYLAYSSSNSTSLDLRAQYDSATPAGWGGFYDDGAERIALAARNGTSGRGGLIDVKNNSALNTMMARSSAYEIRLAWPPSL